MSSVIELQIQTASTTHKKKKQQIQKRRKESTNHFRPLEREGLLVEGIGGFGGLDSGCIGGSSSDSESGTPPGSGRLEVTEAAAIGDY